MNSIWKEKFTIHVYDVDCFGRAKPFNLFSFLLNCAWRHVSFSDYSFENLDKINQFWVLSKILIVFNKYPMWNDEIIIETYGNGTDRFYAFRDFNIYSSDGTKIIQAASSWLLLDKTSYRPQRMDKLSETFPMEIGIKTLDIELLKLQEPLKQDLTSEFMVHFSDIDVNRHVNSSRYMQWLYDSYPANVLEEKIIESFEINYFAEAKLGDLITIKIDKNVTQDYCNIRRKDDGKELCRAAIKWKDI